jgi:hypothetical protein
MRSQVRSTVRVQAEAAAGRFFGYRPQEQWGVNNAGQGTHRIAVRKGGLEHDNRIQYLTLEITQRGFCSYRIGNRVFGSAQLQSRRLQIRSGLVDGLLGQHHVEGRSCRRQEGYVEAVARFRHVGLSGS